MNVHFLIAFLIILATIILVFFGVTYICFYITFYVPKKHKKPKSEFDLPPGDEYIPFHDTMINWMKEVRKLPHRQVSITSFDGLTLYGKYFEYAKGAPIELMFHGYRGNAERDLCGGVQRCFALGRNVLLVDQRGSNKSGGNIISFGINESRDCAYWVDYIVKTFGDEQKIILCGISMGAATVMIAAGRPLPKNVIGALADCGYTSARDIIKKTIAELHLPPSLLYPFVKLGAKLYGHFDLEETSPYEVMHSCKVPMIFIHGEADDFVPCKMSVANHAVCKSAKKLVTVPCAGHGAAYLVDPKGYLNALREFSKHMNTTEITKK